MISKSQVRGISPPARYGEYSWRATRHLLATASIHVIPEPITRHLLATASIHVIPGPITRQITRHGELVSV
jgi:hypothetical protein